MRYHISCWSASIDSTQIISRDLPEQSTWQFYNMVEAQYEQLISLPNAKSKVWEYFGFPGDSKGKIIDKKKVYCKLCEPTVAISYSTNTSNLTYHLLKRYPEEHRNVTEVKDRVPGLQQATLQEAIASAVPYAKDSKRAKQLVSTTADFICQGLQPINVVDEPSFEPCQI